MSRYRTVVPSFVRGTAGCIVVRRANATEICRVINNRSTARQLRVAGTH